MEIQQTFLNHFKVLGMTILTTFLYFLCWWLFGFERDFLFILLGFYTLTVVPSFYLHLSYFFKNKGMICKILADGITVTINGNIVILSSSDIREIEVHKSASMDKGGIPITPMESYFFVRILCRNNQKIDISCLMDTNIDTSIKKIQGVKIFRENGLFNFM